MRRIRLQQPARGNPKPRPESTRRHAAQGVASAPAQHTGSFAQPQQVPLPKARHERQQAAGRLRLGQAVPCAKTSIAGDAGQVRSASFGLKPWTLVRNPSHPFPFTSIDQTFPGLSMRQAAGDTPIVATARTRVRGGDESELPSAGRDADGRNIPAQRLREDRRLRFELPEQVGRNDGGRNQRHPAPSCQ